MQAAWQEATRALWGTRGASCKACVSAAKAPGGRGQGLRPWPHSGSQRVRSFRLSWVGGSGSIVKGLLAAQWAGAVSGLAPMAARLYGSCEGRSEEIRLTLGPVCFIITLLLAG